MIMISCVVHVMGLVSMKVLENKVSSVHSAIYVQSGRKLHTRHDERRSLRIILDSFVLPILSQWGTSFHKGAPTPFALPVPTWCYNHFTGGWTGRRRPR